MSEGIEKFQSSYHQHGSNLPSQDSAARRNLAGENSTWQTLSGKERRREILCLTLILHNSMFFLHCLAFTEEWEVVSCKNCHSMLCSNMMIMLSIHVHLREIIPSLLLLRRYSIISFHCKQLTSMSRILLHTSERLCTDTPTIQPAKMQKLL